MIFQITDIPRILPELMLMLLALLVLGSDVLERWGSGAQAQIERGKAAGQLAAVGLGIVLAVALVQSRFLFRVPEPGGNVLLNIFINLGRNLQAGGPGGSPIAGAFATDELTMVARIILIAGALIVSLLALAAPAWRNPGELYALILFSTAAMCVMAAATEMILAYVALELSSLSLYVLVGAPSARASADAPRQAEAGAKYFLFGALSSGLLLYGMSLAYGFAASAANASSSPPAIGTLFSEVARGAQLQGSGTPLATLALVFIVAGLGYKIAAAPFHSWAPDVYQGAPPIITALIAASSKAAGFFLLFRLLTQAFPDAAGSPSLALFGGWTGLLAGLALLTLLFGNLAALPQTNARRLLAYSSIGHAGFILLSFLLWSQGGVDARILGTSSLLYYLASYALTSLGAFGALAVAREQLGGDDIADLQGLARRNGGLALLLSLCVLSLAGIPPLAGFWAKLLVFLAAYRAGALWLVAVALAMTVVSLAYYLRLIRAIWGGAPATEAPVALSRSAGAALAVAAAFVVLLGLLPGVVWGVLETVVQVAGQ